MAQQVINIGAQADDGTGDKLRMISQKVNANFDELYALRFFVTSGIQRYATVSDMEAVTDSEPGQIAQVYANNGDPADPANGVYQWDASTSAWVLAPWYFDGVASVVQPLVDEAEAARDLSVAAASAARIYATHPAALYLDGSGGEIFDFTDKLSTGVTSLADTVSQIDGLLGRFYLGLQGGGATPLTPELSRGRLVLSSVTDTDGIITQSGHKMIPTSGEWTLAWSQRSNDPGARPVIWQQQGGATGRLQITANATFSGSSIVQNDGYLNVFIGGATDGSGASGQPAPAIHPVGQWSDFMLIVRAGAGNSEFWCNGVLVDTFTHPGVTPDIQTTFYRNTAQPVAPDTGQTMGRVMCIHRAIDSDERTVVRKWVRESFDTQITSDEARWVDPEVTASAAIIWSQNPLGGGEMIWGENESTPLRPASMTKLMTALTALHWLRKMDAMDTLFEREAGDSNAGSGANLNVGDIIDLENALANLGLPSSNVTANVCARVVGELILASESSSGDGTARFVQAMNDFSADIGLTGSVWVNPSGLDETGHVSTATDMALLCQYAGQHEPDITRMWANATWPLVITGPNPRTITITHSVDFIEHGDPRITWGKTGTTPLGGNCLLCEVNAPKGNRYYYVAFNSTSDAERYSDADLVMLAADTGVDWPMLVPRLGSSS